MTKTMTRASHDAAILGLAGRCSWAVQMTGTVRCVGCCAGVPDLQGLPTGGAHPDRA
jgi:hypothetical protein